MPWSNKKRTKMIFKKSLANHLTPSLRNPKVVNKMIEYLTALNFIVKLSISSQIPQKSTFIFKRRTFLHIEILNHTIKCYHKTLIKLIIIYGCRNSWKFCTQILNFLPNRSKAVEKFHRPQKERPNFSSGRLVSSRQLRKANPPRCSSFCMTSFASPTR